MSESNNRENDRRERVRRQLRERMREIFSNDPIERLESIRAILRREGLSDNQRLTYIAREIKEYFDAQQPKPRYSAGTLVYLTTGAQQTIDQAVYDEKAETFMYQMTDGSRYREDVLAALAQRTEAPPDDD